LAILNISLCITTSVKQDNIQRQQDFWAIGEFQI
jgi:hypothetical protein